MGDVCEDMAMSIERFSDASSGLWPSSMLVVVYDSL